MGRYCAALILYLCGNGFAFAENVPPLYQEVAQKYQIPPVVLYALAYGESKVQLDSGLVRPWPWTLNVKGQSYYYSTFDEGCTALLKVLQTTEMVDIGLAQHNWHWQKAYFSSPCDAFLPRLNLEHAASLLNKGKEARGTWVAAAGFYHRPAGGAPARRYEATFVKHLNQLRGM